MDIKGLGLGTLAGSNQTNGDRQVLDRDAFLKLFVAQMEHQDPLNPMEAYEISAQLAQFSSLEQLHSLNENMSNLIAYQTSQNNLQLLSLIDKKVEVVADTLALKGGTATEAWYELSGEATSSTINIYSENGTCVRSLSFGVTPAGRHALNWDGRDNSGAVLPDGRYYFDIKARDGAGYEVPVNTSVCGRVKGLGFEGGITSLTLEDGTKVGVADVVKVLGLDVPGSTT